MKKRIIAALLIGALSTSLPLTCLAEAETESAETAAEDEAEEGEELKTIGEEVEGCLTFTVKNSSKKVIVGISIKSEEDGDYPENLKMEDNEAFEKSGRRTLYYTAPVSEDGEEDGELKKYDIRLTFEDQSTATLHQVALEDIEDGKLVIRVKDGVYYAAYTSIETKEEADTYEAEKAIADEEAAQAAAEAQAAAAAQAAAEAAAAQAAAAQPAEGGGDGCLEGGLLN